MSTALDQCEHEYEDLVHLAITFTFEHRITEETAKLSVVRVNILMTFQFICSIETTISRTLR